MTRKHRGCFDGAGRWGAVGGTAQREDLVKHVDVPKAVHYALVLEGREHAEQVGEPVPVRDARPRGDDNLDARLKRARRREALEQTRHLARARRTLVREEGKRDRWGAGPVKSLTRCLHNLGILMGSARAGVEGRCTCSHVKKASLETSRKMST